MDTVQPAAGVEPGDWLLRPEVGWQDLVRFGPAGFAVYLRIAFADPGLPGEDPTMRRALEVLAAHTATPDRAYAAIWEGWTNLGSAPAAPRVEVPNRTMLLFTGPLAAMRDAPGLAWLGCADDCYQEPHLVWPEDRSWCLACEVDEEIEFSIGCSEEAARAAARALPGAVRRASYGELAPLWRE